MSEAENDTRGEIPLATLRMPHVEQAVREGLLTVEEGDALTAHLRTLDPCRPPRTVTENLAIAEWLAARAFFESALAAALEERDEWQTQHGYAMEGQKSRKHTAEQNLERAERAEAALAEALDVVARWLRFETSPAEAEAFLREHEADAKAVAKLERARGRQRRLPS